MSVFGETVRAFGFLVFADGAGDSPALCAAATAMTPPIRTKSANVDSTSKSEKLRAAVDRVNGLKPILAQNFQFNRNFHFEFQFRTSTAPAV